MRAWFGRLLVGGAIAWLIFAGIVFGRYADEAVPTSYLIRPLGVALLLAVPVAFPAAFSGRWAAAVAASGAVAALMVVVGYLMAAVVLVSVVLTHLASRRGRRWRLAETYTRATVTFVAAFFLLGVLRAAMHIDSPGRASAGSVPAGPSVYMVLLDGYPRADTLSQDLGIDNGPFLLRLAERGFDVYEEAHSGRTYTELTLISMLNASEVGVAQESGTADDKRAARRRLDEARLPLLALAAGHEYVVIDSPIGHVSYGTGTHIVHAGVNNFEERLLGQMSLGDFTTTVAPHLLTSSLRGHLDDSLSSLVELSEPERGRFVFAHLMAPHLPFLYAADGSALPVPSYWPRHQLFGSVIEDIGISFDDYREGYRGNLGVVNDKLIATVDAMLARDPDAVILLFSDHGARYSFEEPEEWKRSFLAARTPGRANLFGASPSTTFLLCELFLAYLDLPCQ